MSRLSRAEMQGRNRARVLGAAQDEFTERGFREAKIDAIAERAELTRGAVYSNFPGKRALYFAVLADLAEHALPDGAPGRTTGDALAALARAWLSRLPLIDEQQGTARLGMDVMPEVLADEQTRTPYAQLMMLDAVLLGLALERLRPDGGRLVRVAETVLTTLHGASQLAAAAPGFLEPFNVVTACAQLAYLDLPDGWPDLPFTTPVQTVDEPWTPSPAWDSVRGETVPLTDDGVVAVLGLRRASAVEHAVRAAPNATVTAVLVSSAPDELMPLARLAVTELTTCIRAAFPAFAWPRLRVVYDNTGTLAAAAGIPAVSDTTETAIRVHAGRVVARADGYGACHVVATQHHSIR
jgi:AcrR family transcriptional regulator